MFFVTKKYYSYTRSPSWPSPPFNLTLPQLALANPNAALSHRRTITLFTWGGDDPGGISEPGPASRRDARCLSWMLQAFRWRRMNSWRRERKPLPMGTHSSRSFLPTRCLPLPDLAPFGAFVYDNGQCEFARRIDPRYMEDYTFMCCCHPFCDSAIRLDLFQEVVSITEGKEKL